MKSETSAASARTSPVDGPYAWFRLTVSVLLATVSGIGMWAFVLVLPAVESDFGVDRASASLPYTMTMAGFAIGNVIYGRFFDRMGIAMPAITAAVALGGGGVPGTGVRLAHGPILDSHIWLDWGAILEGPHLVCRIARPFRARAGA